MQICHAGRHMASTLAAHDEITDTASNLQKECGRAQRSLLWSKVCLGSERGNFQADSASSYGCELN